MTTAEAEAALDDLPELSEEEKAACEAIDIQAILRAATDPNNASPEWMLRKMVDAARGCEGFDAKMVAEMDGYLERRFS